MVLGRQADSLEYRRTLAKSFHSSHHRNEHSFIPQRNFHTSRLGEREYSHHTVKGKSMRLEFVGSRSCSNSTLSERQSKQQDAIGLNCWKYRRECQRVVQHGYRTNIIMVFIGIGIRLPGADNAKEQDTTAVKITKAHPPQSTPYCEGLRCANCRWP